MPFVVSWPAKLPVGEQYTLPVSSLDVFATSLAVAGVPMPTDRKYDSVNLIPFLAGENEESPHNRLFWRHGASLAVRQSDSKLVQPGPNQQSLYDLKSDIGETTDLLSQQTEAASRLSQALQAWDSEMVPPAFSGATARQNQNKAAPNKAAPKKSQ